MIELINGVPQRIAQLQAKLKARKGKKEFKENCIAIQAEIDRLEAATKSRAELAEFLESEGAVASEDTAGSAA